MGYEFGNAQNDRSTKTVVLHCDFCGDEYLAATVFHPHYCSKPECFSKQLDTDKADEIREDSKSWNDRYEYEDE